MILNPDELNGDELLLKKLGQRRLGGRARNDCDALISQIGHSAKLEVRLGQQAAAVDEGHQAKINPFLPRKTRRARPAFDIHLTRGHHLEATSRRYRHPVKFEIDPELLLNRACHMRAKIDGIAHRPPIWPWKGERRRRLEVTQRECRRVLDFLEVAVQFLPRGRNWTAP